MPKRKYSLYYLAGWINDAWFDGLSSVYSIYKELIQALLSMDGLKPAWIVTAAGDQDIAIRYMLAQDLLRRVAKILFCKSRIPNELPWIENKAIYYKLVGRTLLGPLEACVGQGHCGFLFLAGLSENQKYLPKKTRTQPGKAEVAQFNIRTHCERVRHESEFSKERYHGYFAAFTKDKDHQWHLVVADINRDQLIDISPDNFIETIVLWHKLVSPKSALVLRDPLMDLSMILSTIRLRANRSEFELFIAEVSMFQASEATSAKYLPSPSANVNVPTDPSETAESVESNCSAASESDLDFSSLSLGDIDDERVPF